ncbi:hypothetical protein D5b_00254 [Faustovirus]|nr:hypothetical protein D5b_00254 [Faustovirus]AMN84660.1 hypothetical protein D6_00257 [Faustovirus]AMP44206.1 hypothetical protein PRJ_Dakar_00250 [Faustovirus]
MDYDITFANVDAPIPKTLATKITDMPGMIVVVMGWNTPFNKKLKSEQLEDYKILVYDQTNKKVYETTYPNHTTSLLGHKEIKCETVLKTQLNLRDATTPTSCMPLSNVSYGYYKTYVVVNGTPMVSCYAYRTHNQNYDYGCIVNYLVCDQWTNGTSAAANIKDMNGCALHILNIYKTALLEQPKTREVLDFKL